MAAGATRYHWRLRMLYDLVTLPFQPHGPWFSSPFSGRYRFAAPLGSYYVRFIPPPGFVLSPRDQGADDGADSDADPATGNTMPFSPAVTAYNHFCPAEGPF